MTRSIGVQDHIDYLRYGNESVEKAQFEKSSSLR